MSEVRYLLVDAMNVIHATDDLRCLLSEGPGPVREVLAERLRAIHDAEAVRVALVLDSSKAALEVEHPYGVKTFEMLYAPASLSADGVIERIVHRAPYPGSVTVVSNDNMVREATRAAGALALRPDELWEWAGACANRLSRDALRRQAENARSFRNGLDLNF